MTHCTGAKRTSKQAVVFFGPPGVGKGTVASRLAEKLGYVFISSGDLLRENVRRGTELGAEARSFMESGGLVPDQLVTRMVLDALQGATRVLLDGFPRTLKQAQELSNYLETNGFSLKVINLDADDGFLKDRLVNRLICRNCGFIYHTINLPPRREGVCDRCDGPLYQREDDRGEVVARRLEVYHRESAPLKQHYQRSGLMVTVRGDKPLEETLAAVRGLLQDS